MSEEVDELAPGTLVDGRYTVEGVIGRGGMATVYRVRHRHLDTQHALKVLSVGGPALHRRLQQEGRVQAALQHPNIVAVTDMVAVESAPGLVMEFVRGPSLETLLEKRRPNLDQIDNLAVGILDGVAAAHALGLIHRDLKPANVMVAVTANTLVAKVADFGLVKLIASEEGGSFSKTRSGMAMGTPAYMAPEQIEDAKNVDARADIWSLGAILFEIATGERAFDAANILSIFLKVSNNDRKKVRDLRPDLPDRIIDAIEGALTANRDDRIPDVKTLRSTWLRGASLPAESPWDDEWLKLAGSLGAAADSTRDFLERSFRSGMGPVLVQGNQPHLALRKDQPTFMPGQAPVGATAVPLPGSGGTTGAGSMAATVADSQPSVGSQAGVATLLQAPADAVAPALAPTDTSPVGRGVVAGFGVIGLLGGGAVIALLLVVIILLVVTPKPGAGPEPKPDPAQVKPAPEAPKPEVPAPGPGQKPEPERPDPAPVRPDPAIPKPGPKPGPVVPDPKPVIVVPSPTPVPGPDPVPVPVPGPPPVPEAPRTAIVLKAAGMTATLYDGSGKKVQPGALPPGTYKVVAFFDPAKPTDSRTFENFTIADGQTLTIECVKSQFRCIKR